MNIKREDLDLYAECLIRHVGAGDMISVPVNVIITGDILFQLKDTYGLPLSMIIQAAMDEGFFISWPEYIHAAMSHGHKLERVCAQINEAMSDSGYKTYVAERWG